MTAREVVLVTHRWIGLLTSVVLAIVGATGVVILYGSDIESIALLRRVAGRFHERLALGHPGWWIVVASTAAAVLLQLGGLVLWWRKKTVMVQSGRGLLRTSIDLHHAFGVVFLPLMLILAVTGIGMAFVTGDDYPNLRPLVAQFHTGRFIFPIHVLYAIASLGFVLQGLTGVLMWWKTRR